VHIAVEGHADDGLSAQNEFLPAETKDLDFYPEKLRKEIGQHADDHFRRPVRSC